MMDICCFVQATQNDRVKSSENVFYLAPHQRNVPFFKHNYIILNITT